MKNESVESLTCHLSVIIYSGLYDSKLKFILKEI
ncbi:hypothetical protein BH20ACI4_BH20ACI4_01900 [soil metagenome]